MQAAENTIPFPTQDNLPANPPKNYDKLLLGLVPFTPVQFSGTEASIAWGRLIGYSLIAYYAYNRMRPISYVAMGAAGVSLATSLTAKIWNKK